MDDGSPTTIRRVDRRLAGRSRRHQKDVYESCYLLGINIIFYSCQEKHKWNEAQKTK